MRGGDDSDDDGGPTGVVPAPATKKNRKERTADRHNVVATREGGEEAVLRSQLRSLLAQPLLPSFTSLKFITHNPLLNEGVNPGLAVAAKGAKVLKGPGAAVQEGVAGAGPVHGGGGGDSDGEDEEEEEEEDE